jgi:hypothetical protein
MFSSFIALVAIRDCAGRDTNPMSRWLCPKRTGCGSKQFSVDMSIGRLLRATGRIKRANFFNRTDRTVFIRYKDI